MANRAGRTAWGPMVQVALEQYVSEEQRVIQDPLAYCFLPASLQLAVRAAGRSSVVRERLFALLEGRVPGIRGGILCRKRHIDDLLSEALSRGVQAVVILGSGMDTRAYRLPDIDTIPVYELDLPEVIDAKQAALRRALGTIPDHVCLTPIDFEREDVSEALSAGGYRAGTATFIIWEGVTQYLDEAAVRRTLESIRPSAAGSGLAFTYIRRDFIDSRNLYDLGLLYRQTRVTKSFWKFGLEPGDVAAFIASYGWLEVEQVGSEEYQELYLRPAGRSMPVMAVERTVFADSESPWP